MVNGPLLRLTVFFPCHNEEANVERVTRQALEVLGRISDDYEVIIVNDGSRDRTAEIADHLARENSRVRVIHHPVNRGYGGALQSGFGAATKEWVFATDGDGQFDLNELPGFVELAGPYDIVAGYRLNRQDPWPRKLNGWAWTRLVNFLFGLKIRDMDCAFKLFRRVIFDRIEMHSQGALIATEIMARAQRAGFKITQHGVRHYPRTAGKQTGANLKVILRAFKELFRLRRRILGGE